MKTSAMLWMWLVTFLVAPLHGQQCKNLTGYWYNKLGSEMLLTTTADSELVGEYRTAVERRPGAAGTSHSAVIGTIAYEAGAMFGYAVTYREGKSTAAWTGQCLVCGGVEVLVTTWLLRAQIETCVDKWRSTYIGQNYYTREEQRSGPRKRLGTHTPLRPGEVGRRRRRDLLLAQLLANKRSRDVERKRYRRSDDNGTRQPCSLDGVWYNLIGSQIELTLSPNGEIKGTYRTAREVSDGKPSGKHSGIFGIANYNFKNRTLAFFVSWNDGKSVTGWVGQCHLCKDDNDTTEVLETTWLHRNPVDSCEQNWKSTYHGENSFYRTPQRPVAEAEELAAEFGEDISDLKIETSSGAGQIMFVALLIMAQYVSVTAILGWT